MIRKLRRFIGDENGVTAIEYGLIASLVAVAAIGAFTSVGTRLTTTMNGIAKQIR